MTFGQPDRFTLLQNQGLWWAPDGSRLLISRVDTSQVQQYWISDQADPGARPVQVRYPRVGTPNAEVSLWLVGLDGSRVVVQTDQGEFEYLTAVTWDGHGPLIAVQSRDQRRLEVRAVDPGTGQASVRFRDTDKIWITLVAGVPRYTASGALIWACDRGAARRLIVDGEPVTPMTFRYARSSTSTGTSSCLPRPSTSPRSTCGRSRLAAGLTVSPPSLGSMPDAGPQGPRSSSGRPSASPAPRSSSGALAHQIVPSRVRPNRPASISGSS